MKTLLCAEVVSLVSRLCPSKLGVTLELSFVLTLWTISDLLIGGVPAPEPDNAADRYTRAAMFPNGQYGPYTTPQSPTSGQASQKFKMSIFCDASFAHIYV